LPTNVFRYKSQYLTSVWLASYNDADILKRMRLDVRCYGNVIVAEALGLAVLHSRELLLFPLSK
jgi:hypothetical protein